jgi:hypothetical protein
MVLDDPLVAAGDEDEMLDPSGLGLVDHMLDHGPIDDRQHLFGHRLGGGQEPRAEPCYGENRLANALPGCGHCRLAVGLRWTCH